MLLTRRRAGGRGGVAIPGRAAGAVPAPHSDRGGGGRRGGVRARCGGARRRARLCVRWFSHAVEARPCPGASAAARTESWAGCRDGWVEAGGGASPRQAARGGPKRAGRRRGSRPVAETQRRVCSGGGRTREEAISGAGRAGGWRWSQGSAAGGLTDRPHAPGCAPDRASGLRPMRRIRIPPCVRAAAESLPTDAGAVHPAAPARA
mmetsp:Transcript_37462/g.119202  ORF Transcript_37462/g.119202 Transcript_37462/m.119202 type:complete len:206 (-) Transcript_37462:127-744(-)